MSLLSEEELKELEEQEEQEEEKQEQEHKQEQEEEEEENEEDEEAFEILINNIKYYVTDDTNSNVYIINDDFSIGDIAGTLSNGMFIVNNI